MNCKESKISLPHSRLRNILCWQLTCTNTVFQYMTTIRDAYSTASMLYPLGNVFCPVQIEAQQDISHVKQMYLSTSMFDNAAIFRGSFPSLRVDYRHTNGALLLWKKKDTSHVSLRLHPKDMSQLIASHWSAILFWNNDGKIPSDNSDNTPEKNTNVDPPPGLPQQPDNNQDDDNNPEPFSTPPSRPHPPNVPMPDDPHTTAKWWLSRWGNAFTTRWTSRLTTVSIITTRSSTTTVSRSPCHTCCTRHRYCAQ